MANFKYACKAMTDNLCYGRVVIGIYPTKEEAQRAAATAGKGAWAVQRVRIQ